MLKVLPFTLINYNYQIGLFEFLSGAADERDAKVESGLSITGQSAKLTKIKINKGRVSTTADSDEFCVTAFGMDHGLRTRG